MHDQVSFTIQLPSELQQQLETSSEGNGRSFNDEIVSRLKASLTTTPVPICHIDQFGAWITARWTLPLNPETAKKIAAQGFNGDANFGFFKSNDMPGVTLSVMPDSVAKTQLADDEAVKFLVKLRE